MLLLLFYVLLAAVSAGLLAILLRIIDARVNESIEQHVNAALGPPVPEAAFDVHVDQALDVASAVPSPRRGADELSELNP